MEFNHYYEEQNSGNYGKRKRGGMVALLISVAIVFLALGIALSGVIWPLVYRDGNAVTAERDMREDFSPNEEKTPNEDPVEEDADQADSQTIQRDPISQQEHKMPVLDGVAPVIVSDSPVADIAEGVNDSVVSILIYKEMQMQNGETALRRYSGGSGFIFSSEGYILTNYHVVQGYDAIEVVFANEKTTSAELVGYDSEMDVAVLKIDFPQIKALEIGDSDLLRTGEYVIAVGTPGVSSQLYDGTVTLGIVSSLNRSVTIDGITHNYIQTDAAINFGNSGGPLLNMEGKVVGINTAKTVTAGFDAYGNSISAEGLSFALPINDVLEKLEVLITEGYVTHPGIGMSVISLTEQDAEMLQMPMGVLVYSVVVDGPAHQAGVKPDDVVQRCDGVSITQQDELIEMIKAKKVGDQITLNIWRNGENLEVTVTIGDKDAMDYNIVEYGEIY